MRVLIALFRYFGKPLDRFLLVLSDAVANVIHEPEVVLRLRMALLGGFCVPLDGFCFVLSDAVAAVVMTPRLNCASALPCSAAFVYQ